MPKSCPRELKQRTLVSLHPAQFGNRNMLPTVIRLFHNGPETFQIQGDIASSCMVRKQTVLSSAGLDAHLGPWGVQILASASGNQGSSENMSSTVPNNVGCKANCVPNVVVVINHA